MVAKTLSEPLLVKGVVVALTLGTKTVTELFLD
jgi:hypothetical protein